MSRLPLALFSVALAAGSPDGTWAAEGLEKVNRALGSWLELMDDDRSYLLVDRDKGELELRHGPAVLRTCAIMADSALAQVAVRSSLREHLRRYRPAHPWARPGGGPFDWEQVLVDQAADDDALYFANRVLMYADDAWGVPRPPFIRLSGADLRALFDALESGAPMVVLPRGWLRQLDDL